MSTNSSNKQIFDIAKPPYKEALKRSGFENFQLKYIPKNDLPKLKRSKSKKVWFCNLPWNTAVRNNIWRDFLSLIDSFKNTPQGKYINHHTVKLSYSTTKNLKSHIASSNLKKLNIKEDSNLEECKCAADKKIGQCPVNNQCMTSKVVYCAEVISKHTRKSYIGMTGRPFIGRWKEHRGNFRHKHQKGTKLSKYAWNQKEFGENIKFEDIKWSLKAKAVPYRAGARYYDTCLSEKNTYCLTRS